MWSTCLERAVRKGLCFALQITFCIDVGGVDGDVPEPGTNRVDVNACAQEMGGGGVSNRVRADALAQQRRTLNTGLLRITTQQPVDTVASDSLPQPIHEHRLIRRARTNQMK
jgi:hypothetical protein